jgi:hypothetical protein
MPTHDEQIREIVKKLRDSTEFYYELLVTAMIHVKMENLTPPDLSGRADDVVKNQIPHPGRETREGEGNEKFARLSMAQQNWEFRKQVPAAAPPEVARYFEYFGLISPKTARNYWRQRDDATDLALSKLDAIERFGDAKQGTVTADKRVPFDDGRGAREVKLVTTLQKWKDWGLPEGIWKDEVITKIEGMERINPGLKEGLLTNTDVISARFVEVAVFEMGEV